MAEDMDRLFGIGPSANRPTMADIPRMSAQDVERNAPSPAPTSFARSFLGPNDLSMQAAPGENLTVPAGRYGPGPTDFAGQFLPSGGMNFGTVPGAPKFNPMNNIAPDMGTFVSPTTVHDNVRQAHKDFEEQFSGPYRSAREEGIVRGKAELMGPGAKGKEQGGLELPDTKWFEEHGVNGGIWIDAQGNHHAMFFPRSEPGTKSVTDQMQPLIDKYVSQVTSQSGAIGPDQLHAAATMMTAQTQAGLAPSEEGLRRAQAASLARPVIHTIPMGEGQNVTIQQMPNGEIKEVTRGAPLLSPEAHAGIASMFNETERDIQKEVSDARLMGTPEDQLQNMANVRRQQLQQNISQYMKLLKKGEAEKKQVFTYSQWASIRRNQGLPVSPEAANLARLEVEKSGHTWANF